MSTAIKRLSDNVLLIFLIFSNTNKQNSKASQKKLYASMIMSLPLHQIGSIIIIIIKERKWKKALIRWFFSESDPDTDWRFGEKIHSSIHFSSQSFALDSRLDFMATPSFHAHLVNYDMTHLNSHKGFLFCWSQLRIWKWCWINSSTVGKKRNYLITTNLRQR